MVVWACACEHRSLWHTEDALELEAVSHVIQVSGSELRPL